MTNPSRIALKGFVLACVLLGVPAGCQLIEGPKVAPAGAPPPSFTGPTYLRGTVGSMVQLQGYRPRKASGFGIVVGLDGTGSREVPAYLRQNLINEMRKRKVGAPSAGWESWTPERMLADTRTAVVAVEGLVPPGAIKGTRFDLLVSAHRDTQTTSLAGGMLWTLDLSEFGTDPRHLWTKRWAEARGPIYLNPLDDAADPPQRDQVRQAIIIGGGVVVRPRVIELYLNQPGFIRSRAISNRINQRFGLTTDPRLIAEAKTDRYIKINIPDRYADQSEELLKLISCLYVIQKGPAFAPEKAEELIDVLRKQGEEDPTVVSSVVTALQALGKTALPVMRQYYDDPSFAVRLALLEAGAWLEDERAAEPLSELAQHSDPAMRIRAAEALVYLPRSIKGSRTLKRLLDDDDQSVRIAAYESLASINDPIIGRVAMVDSQGRTKFIIDRVAAIKPLVYITQRGTPRIAIFNDQLGFATPMLAQLWDRRLMLRTEDGDKPLAVFYQPPGKSDARTFKLMPTVATLCYMLAHRPTLEEPQDGLDMSYSQVVDALYNLCRNGQIEAPVQLDINPLAQLIAEYEQSSPTMPADRPEFGAPGITPEAAPDTQTRGAAVEDITTEAVLSARPETGAATP